MAQREAGPGDRRTRRVGRERAPGLAVEAGHTVWARVPFIPAAGVPRGSSPLPELL